MDTSSPDLPATADAPPTKRIMPGKLPPGVDIFDLPEFPNRTNRLSITPSEIADMIENYANSLKPIAQYLGERNITVTAFYTLLDLYPSIRQRYSAAQQRKTLQYGGAAAVVYTKEIPERFFEADRDGCKRLSNAGVRYMDGKFRAFWRLAQMHESGTYQDVSRSEQRILSKSVNVNVSVSADDLRQAADVGDVFAAIDGILGGNRATTGSGSIGTR